MVIAVIILGNTRIKPFALLAKPLAAVPKITAKKRIRYGITLLTLKNILIL